MANFTVTSLGDNEQAPPPGSLRQTIMDANSNPGPDAIDFAVTGTIVLAGPLPSITDELDITGPGAGILAISGGGVYSPTDASLSTANCTFRQSRSQSRGGAIHMDGARTLAVADSRFAENIADADGGAIWSNTVSPATITGSDFADNRAGVRGGGVAVIASSVLIAASRLRRNVADIAGGAVAASGARLRMTNTQCSDNSGGTDGGGAITADDSFLIDIDDSALSRNMTDGSGAAVLSTSSVTRLTNVTLAQNRAGATGGCGHHPGQEFDHRQHDGRRQLLCQRAQPGRQLLDGWQLPGLHRRHAGTAKPGAAGNQSAGYNRDHGAPAGERSD